MVNFVVFLCGVLFAVGLGLSGMTQPSKVVNFLDFTGNWDPSLMFVMGGAVFVYYIGQRLTLMRDKPALTTSNFQLPTATDVDFPMFIGNVIFGIGWGMAGFCPGPALVSAVSGVTTPIMFLVSMAFGMYAYGAIADHYLTRPSAIIDGGAGIHEHAMLEALEAEDKKHHLP